MEDDLSFIPIPAGAPGLVVPSQAMYAGGTDGTDLRGFATDSSGRQKVLLYDASGNAITSTSSALDENFKLIGGTAVDVNSGNKSNGTQRVVLVTDQPALSTPLPAESYVLGSGDVLIPKRVGNLFYGSNAVPHGTIIAPAVAGKYVYVTGINLSIWPGFTPAFAGQFFVTLIWFTSGNPVFQFIIDLPAGAPTPPAYYPPFVTYPGFYAVNPTINDGIELITNVTTPGFSVQMNYGYTATP